MLRSGAVTAALLFAGRALGACQVPAVPIHALGDVGSTAVRVRGVVVAVMPGLGGFFLEAPRTDWDKDAATSEGIFVYAGHRRLRLHVGTRIQLRAHDQRFHDTPELVHPHAIVRCGHARLPPPVRLRLPLARASGWKGLLGMRVQLAVPVTVDNLHDLGRYGEVRVSAGARRYAPTALTAPGPAAGALQWAEDKRSVWIDDGTTRAHPPTWTLGPLRVDARHTLRAGEILRALTGIAYRAFGRNLLETQSFDLDRKANPRRGIDALHLPRGLRIVTFNVENYFNHARSGPAFPTERGARTRAQFHCQTQKLVAALVALHPDVIALQEIENDGYGRHSAIAALVAALNRATGAPYRYVRPSTARLGTDLIAPALVYNAARLARSGRVAVLAASAHARPALAQGLKRPALAASFRVRAGTRYFTIASVHLRSKLTSCGPRLDSADGAGHCARARLAAARRVGAWLATHPTGVRHGPLLLAGDFNAYPHEAAVRALVRAGWQERPRAGTGPPPYTEAARSGAGDLDYIFTAGPHSAPVRAAVWHIDADEPPALDYAGRPACKGSAAPFRASDHDPVIAVFGGA